MFGFREVVIGVRYRRDGRKINVILKIRGYKFINLGVFFFKEKLESVMILLLIIKIYCLFVLFKIYVLFKMWKGIGLFFK